MSKKVLLGIGKYMLPIPAPGFLWQRVIPREARKVEAKLGFMTEEHRRVHHYVVRELPCAAEPLSPERIAAKVELPVARVKTILDELEKNMCFLFRKGGDSVVWAYPGTVEKTPHHVTFSSGEQLYAA